MTTRIDSRLRAYADRIEAALADSLPGTDSPQRDVVKAMAYALLGGGKRVRGALVLAAYGLFAGPDDAKAMPFACALEMVHAYSLVHDDLPCMDDDDLRRGKPSCHMAFGEDIALLAGDGLLTLAFATCAAPETAAAFGAERVVAALRALAEAAGTGGMIGGQVIDLQSEGRATDLAALRLMDEKKTGALISVAVEIGCILAGADAAVTERLTTYALRLGLAFQIVDDILDQTGDAAVLGKPIGSDSANQKSTYTGHLGLEGAKELAARLSREAKEALEETGLDTGFLGGLTDYLLERRH